MAWPPRSPDLTPCDFFVWGHIKNIVYSENIQNLAHLKDRIRNALCTVSPDILTNVWAEIGHRLDVCRATNGGHIEVY